MSANDSMQQTRGTRHGFQCVRQLSRAADAQRSTTAHAILKTARLFTSAICCLLVFAAGVVWAAEQREKGAPEAPRNGKAIAGAYYRGDGLGCNISLTLKEDGNYAAQWHGCLGKYGEASGKWSLNDKRLTFTPSKEEGMMKGHLRSLEIMRFKGDWIFVPTEKGDRRFYDEWGVNRSSCFQKREKIK